MYSIITPPIRSNKDGELLLTSSQGWITIEESKVPDENLFICSGYDLIKLKIQLQAGDLIWLNDQWLLVNLQIGIQNNSIYAIKI